MVITWVITMAYGLGYLP